MRISIFKFLSTKISPNFNFKNFDEVSVIFTNMSVSYAAQRYYLLILISRITGFRCQCIKEEEAEADCFFQDGCQT